MIFDDRTVRFRREDGSTHELPLPLGIEDQPVRIAGLTQVAAAISGEWARRSDGRGKKKPRTDDLQRSCYQLILHCVEWTSLFEDLRKLSANNKHWERSLREPQNRFVVGLDAIFPRHAKILTPGQRSRLIAEMWFAFRHYIPPALFVGFTFEFGGGDRIRKEGMERIDPIFERWVIERRTDDAMLSRARGAYPARIQKAVRERRRELKNEPGATLRRIDLILGFGERRRRTRDPKGIDDPLMTLKNRRSNGR